MKFIISSSKNAYYNIASEEYLLNQSDDIFYLYQNAPAVIVGINQNTLAEVNYDYIRNNDIKVVRRLSGGGAVYHDLGNINFCFIIRNGKKNDNGFEKYTKPIIDVLKTLGVEAKLEGRNDLTIDGKKFSGNAKYICGDDLLQHGTILFNSKLEDIVSILNVDPDKFKDKAVKSVKSRVTNVSDYLKEPITIDMFINQIVNHLKLLYPEAREYRFSFKEKNEILKLQLNRYFQWDWNYGKTVLYNYAKSIRTKGGTIEVKMIVNKGYIKYLDFFGDFFTKKDIDDFKKIFIDIPHDYNNINDILTQYPATDFFENINNDDILSIIF